MSKTYVILNFIWLVANFIIVIFSIIIFLLINMYDTTDKGTQCFFENDKDNLTKCKKILILPSIFAKIADYIDYGLILDFPLKETFL